MRLRHRAALLAHRARRGPQQSTVATAPQSARAGYHLRQYRAAFQAEAVVDDKRKRRVRDLKQLSRRANTLGSTLIPVAASQPGLAS